MKLAIFLFVGEIHMSDANGKVLIKFSKDYEGDIRQLRDVLNRFRWSSEFDFWKLCEPDNLILGFVQYPQAWPEYYSSVKVFDENSNVLIIENPSAEQIQESYDCGFDPEYENIEIKEIFEIISPVIKRGWVEIFSTQNYPNELPRIEMLRVDIEIGACAKINDPYASDYEFSFKL